MDSLAFHDREFEMSIFETYPEWTVAAKYATIPRSLGSKDGDP